MNSSLFRVITAVLVCLLIFTALNIKRDRPGNCTLPSDTFTSDDLVGKWSAGSPDHQDTLIIRADGRYKQITQIRLPEHTDINYEGDWMEWWVEIASDGIPRLHLDGMRVCAIYDVSCEQVGGPIFDFCRNQGETKSDGFLLVLGVPDGWDQSADAIPAPHGISLWYPMGSENTWVYSLEIP